MWWYLFFICLMLVFVCILYFTEANQTSADPTEWCLLNRESCEVVAPLQPRQHVFRRHWPRRTRGVPEGAAEKAQTSATRSAQLHEDEEACWPTLRQEPSCDPGSSHGNCEETGRYVEQQTCFLQCTIICLWCWHRVLEDINFWTIFQLHCKLLTYGWY